MKVVGIDPGSHTGLVVWTDEVNGARGYRLGKERGEDNERRRQAVKRQYINNHGKVLEAYELTGDEGEWNALGIGRAYGVERWREREYAIAMMCYGTIVRAAPQVVVVEDFVLRGGQLHSSSRAGLSAMRVQAMLHAILLSDEETLSKFRLLWYTASVARGYATDARLREWGLWLKGSPHKRDALRHALAGYMQVTGQ